LNNPSIPNAKFDDLVVQEFTDEVLIYDLQNNKAYSLNETSTLIWRLCDGTKDAGQIASEIAGRLNQPVPEGLVWLALDNLKKDGLVFLAGDESSIFHKFNRREVIKMNNSRRCDGIAV
jgi:hypothetical protein